MSNQRVSVLPYPAQGHVNSLMNFSRKLAERGFKILFVNTDFNHKRIMASLAEQDSLVGSNIELLSIPDGLGPEENRNDLGKLCSALMNTMPGLLEKFIEDINVDDTHSISCIVADVNMGWALEVAKKLGIRGAVLWTASAAMFALQYSIPRMIDDGFMDCNGTPFQKRKFQLSPSMPTMDVDQIFWSNMGDEENQKHIFHYVKGFTKISNLTDWWLCNTTYELEPGALSFLPKLLPIGPFIGNSHRARSLGQFWKEDLSCLNWLNQHPPYSVIYLAFGSFTLFNPKQFKELALGLNSPTDLFFGSCVQMAIAA
ncbi:hypothetical protein L6164_006727 [Bauhinia variegata]|uniref:Uncharacterized protein n=1 Tax=Bauhinia variegata TaxID=167791 RepID=A0ACB9PV60_BAUVA|nr:hypothetical protein L6164_006727 [Bauhinia variegata]